MSNTGDEEIAGELRSCYLTLKLISVIASILLEIINEKEIYKYLEFRLIL